MATKKFKISHAKRSAHLKQKKTPLTKQQQQKQKQLKEQQRAVKDKTRNIFEKRSKQRENLVRQKQRKHNTQQTQHGGDHDDDDDDHVGADGTGEALLQSVADMLDGDDLAMLHGKPAGKRKRKLQDGKDEDVQRAVVLEKEFTAKTQQEQAKQKVTINLLPIKSRDGEIIARTAEVDFVPKKKRAKAAAAAEKPASDDDDDDGNDNANNDDYDDDGDSVYEDSDDDIVNDVDAAPTDVKHISTMDLLLAREQEIERQKYRIGVISSGILEQPEQKLRNFNALFELMGERNAEGVPNLIAVRKVAIVSVTELFKDILPEYRVGQVDPKMQTLRKATLQRVSYESTLLQQFKKFLQRLEQLTAVVTKRNMGKRTPQAVGLAVVAVQSMCDILLEHPYFNYVQNVAQLLVFMLNSNYTSIRTTVNGCFRTLFATDKRLDMTLFIVRRINHLIKTRNNSVHVECLKCLLALKIKNVNLDAEKENELKQKKLENHRQRLLSLSKKERKRRKKLTELTRELQETRAEENKQSKQHKLTEIIKMVFTIYFRVLKDDPTTSVLSAVLEGLAEFAHVINLDFFSDLIEVLNRILEETELGYKEQLHCIKTIFVILSGQGEVLNIDPLRFYQHFYRNMLIVHAGKNHEDFSIILSTLDEVLVKRRRNMSQQRLMAFIKRLLTGSLQLLHHGTMATLGTIKTTFQLTSVLDTLLDTDASIGSGRYDPECDDPEYCNAGCTALYELALLARHYHPIVRKLAAHIAHAVPATGEFALPSDLGKLTNHELYERYNSNAMVFNPTIPLPKPATPKIKKSERDYLRADFPEICKSLLKSNVPTNMNATNELLQFDFIGAFNKNK